MVEALVKRAGRPSGTQGDPSALEGRRRRGPAGSRHPVRPLPGGALHLQSRAEGGSADPDRGRRRHGGHPRPHRRRGRHSRVGRRLIRAGRQRLRRWRQLGALHRQPDGYPRCSGKGSAGLPRGHQVGACQLATAHDDGRAGLSRAVRAGAMRTNIDNAATGAALGVQHRHSAEGGGPGVTLVVSGAGLGGLHGFDASRVRRPPLCNSVDQRATAMSPRPSRLSSKPRPSVGDAERTSARSPTAISDRAGLAMPAASSATAISSTMPNSSSDRRTASRRR